MSKSSSSSATKKNWGLVLTLPGAPDVPHTIAGITGVYRPSEPTPIGGPGEPTLEQAKEIANSPEAPVKLVEVGPRKIETLREEQPETIDEVADAGQED